MGPWWWGGPCDDDAGSESGSASVFDGASGAQLRKLRAADGALGAANDYFGRPVVASSGGSLVVVGALTTTMRAPSAAGSAPVFDGGSAFI